MPGRDIRDEETQNAADVEHIHQQSQPTIGDLLCVIRADLRPGEVLLPAVDLL